MKHTNSPPIICGTDFSENARRAASAAATLAKLHGAPLRLVHASVIPRSTLTHAQLRAEAQRLHDDGARLTAEVIEGEADKVLVQAARQHAARLLMVSASGLPVAARWLIGSAAERIAESSTVPTIVVRAAGPFESWAGGERPLRVFVGADFTASSDAALRWVRGLQQLGPIEVFAVYAGKAVRAASPGGWRCLKQSPPSQRLLERTLREKITRMLGEKNVHIRVAAGSGRAETRLVEMAIGAQADLIVVGAHQRHGLRRLQHRSVSRGILQHAPINVACVPERLASGTMAPPSPDFAPHMPLDTPAAPRKVLNSRLPDESSPDAGGRVIKAQVMPWLLAVVFGLVWTWLILHLTGWSWRQALLLWLFQSILWLIGVRTRKKETPIKGRVRSGGLSPGLAG